MTFVVLQVNEISLYIPINKVGILSVSNNKGENEFVYLVRDNIDQRRPLYLGDKIEIKLISLSSVDAPSYFELPDDFCMHTDKWDDNIPEGIEVRIKDEVISAPFIKGGALSVMITVNKGTVDINIGGITKDVHLLDYYRSEMNVNDVMTISLKGLHQISKPINSRCKF